MGRVTSQTVSPPMHAAQDATDSSIALALYCRCNAAASPPAEVFVIPHSHNDPGWLKTFEGYFLSNTAHILNNMVDFLTKNRDFSFLWAEVCFFSRWWRSLQNRPHLRDAVRRLVHRGQLEMVTGGWVMTDEAAAHYFAMVDQLVEGHQWLRTNLGVVPRNGWSIDPFGHGATMPYILQASGIRSTFVQRTHYAWKQFLAARRQLEFLWQPPFPTSSQRVLSRRNNSSGVLCHMAPFELYSIKHTCGPDPEVCLKFDFRRMAGEYTESRASIVNPNNVAELAKELLGQYGRIGSLFPHNVALVPLGDDFRFDRDAEWIQQHKNYRRLFDYINTNSKKLHANRSTEDGEDVSSAAVRGSSLVPTLEGDFHPYGDVYAEGTPSYWTGYYTTRPYLKHFCRELEHWLRAAEIIYSLARSYLHQTHMKELAERMDAEYVFLVQSRDSLGLFMHHDAITGTSKEGVMTDYGSRMFNGMKEAMGPTFEGGYNAPHSMISYLFPDIDRQSFEVLPSKVPLTVPGVIGRKVVLYNSHAQHVQEVVRVHVKTLVTKVTSPSNSDIPFQINPVWDDAAMMSTDVFEMMRRVTNVELPIEANYYPITSAAYLEDKTSRMTLVVSHAHGAASIQPGSLEVMLDRKLRYDDSRGLGEGVMDNRKTVARFWLTLEERRSQPGSTKDGRTPELVSAGSHTLCKDAYPANYLGYGGQPEQGAEARS
ncbi:hypothetical protein HPB47_009959 [Ixodes persulcatus]|uniref:Uncharacterized protein n=1 Tax=Ixodes persulcatus TaxID=34615 RepID=A0AC60P0J1_IXOPE|nr:hypothetical protein HPB47_009959 [Ixodes persulcatus]